MIISSIPDNTRIVFDTRYLRCKCRFYELRLPYIFGSLGIKNSIGEIGLVSRYNDIIELSSRHSILRYFESLIPIPYGVTILRYRYHLTQL